MNESMKEKLLEELLEMFQNMPEKEDPKMEGDKKGASIEMMKIGGHALNDDEGAELKDKLKGMC